MNKFSVCLIAVSFCASLQASAYECEFSPTRDFQQPGEVGDIVKVMQPDQREELLQVIGSISQGPQANWEKTLRKGLKIVARVQKIGWIQVGPEKRLGLTTADAENRWSIEVRFEHRLPSGKRLTQQYSTASSEMPFSMRFSAENFLPKTGNHDESGLLLTCR